MTGLGVRVHCPAGHVSATTDRCDVCGATIGPMPAAVVPTPAAAAAVTEPPLAFVGTIPCPGCGADHVAGHRFCGSCGWDFVAGAAPAASAQVSAAQAPAWTALATADQAWWAATGVDVPFPSACPPRSFTVGGEQVGIGRRSGGRGINPDIDLSGPPLDPGISHLHALLTRGPDGGWLLSDPGSTNGTYLNDAADPLVPGVPTPVADGDRIHVGAWTTLTLRAPR